MTDTYPLKLTVLESYYLSDAVSEFMPNLPPPDGEFHAYPDFILKLGGVVLDATQMKKDVVVEMSLVELRVIREVCKTSIMVGSERVGLNLTLKVYEGLRTLSAGGYINDHDGVEEGPKLTKSEVASRMNEFRRKEQEGIKQEGNIYDEHEYD